MFSETMPSLQQMMLAATSKASKSKSKSKSRTACMRALDPSFVPGDHDVLCAKGKDAKQHPGNVFLKSLIRSHLEEYRAADNKLERSYVVSKILKQIEASGGKFVRQIKGGWADIGTRNSREKLGQAFRDLLHDQYRSSTKSKASIRRSQAIALLGPSDDSSSSSSESCRSENQPELPQIPTSILSLDALQASFFDDFCTTNFSPDAATSAAFPDTPLSFESHSLKEPYLLAEDMEPLPVCQSPVQIEFDDSMPCAQALSASFEDDMQEMTCKSNFLINP